MSCLPKSNKRCQSYASYFIKAKHEITIMSVHVFYQQSNKGEYILLVFIAKFGDGYNRKPIRNTVTAYENNEVYYIW